MARPALTILVVVIVFGILMPLVKGLGILMPSLALLFVAPASAELAATHGKGAPVSGMLAKIAISKWFEAEGEFLATRSDQS